MYLKNYYEEGFMAYFEWDPSLNIGIDIIDEQHKKIVEYVNDLDSILNNKNFDSNFLINSVAFKDKLKKIVDELVNYTITHFAFEEDMMEKANYTLLKSHKQEHKIFTNIASSYQQRFKNGDDIAFELLEELKTWLSDHITKEDMDYHSEVLKNSNDSNKTTGLKSKLKSFWSKI